jgi:hypothetical protein
VNLNRRVVIGNLMVAPPREEPRDVRKRH